MGPYGPNIHCPYGTRWAHMMDPDDPRRISKSTLQLIRLEIWTSRCPLGVPVHPWITQIVTQGLQNGPSRSPNDSFGYKKVIPFSVSSCLLTEGRRQGRRGGPTHPLRSKKTQTMYVVLVEKARHCSCSETRHCSCSKPRHHSSSKP